MKARLRAFVGLALFGLACLRAVAVGEQAATPSPAESSTRQVHSFTYKTDVTSDATVFDASYPFALTIQHKGVPRYLGHLNVRPIGETSRYFSKVDCSPREFKIHGEGSSITVHCELTENSNTSDWQRILARSKDYPLEVVPTLAGQEKETIISPFTQVRISAGFIAICVGGFAGAFLLSLFRLSSNFLRVDRVPKQTRTWFTDLGHTFPHTATAFFIRIFECIVFGIRGSLISLLVIMLTQSLGTLNMPISIRVEDFYGGVVVGLFSIPLSSWLATKLEGRSDDAAKTKGTEPTVALASARSSKLSDAILGAPQKLPSSPSDDVRPSESSKVR